MIRGYWWRKERRSRPYWRVPYWLILISAACGALSAVAVLHAGGGPLLCFPIGLAIGAVLGGGWFFFRWLGVRRGR